jgi:hypothetical protein
MEVVRFTEEPVRTRKGRPRVQIPEEIVMWCEHTYTNRVSCEVPLAPGDEGTETFLTALRIYARRQGKAVWHEFVTIEGITYLRFRMKDKMVLKKAELPKEK